MSSGEAGPAAVNIESTEVDGEGRKGDKGARGGGGGEGGRELKGVCDAHRLALLAAHWLQLLPLGGDGEGRVTQNESAEQIMKPRSSSTAPESPLSLLSFFLLLLLSLSRWLRRHSSSFSFSSSFSSSPAPWLRRLISARPILLSPCLMRSCSRDSSMKKCLKSWTEGKKCLSRSLECDERMDRDRRRRRRW